jgi:demethylmenaquinone methyltransferase / 2-methoxy-6-polyprenyl-1,4-benzoquinol methylase
MVTPPEQPKDLYVRRMFARIAGRYDVMNRLMTGGQDVFWRKIVVRYAHLKNGESLLDLGTGTGDIAQEVLRQVPGVKTVGGDFTLEMMYVGRMQPTKQQILWLGCDAQKLPFSACSFDAVVSGFLLRNVTSVDIALREQYRVLKPGGRVVALDTTPPPGGLVGKIIRLYLRFVIPLLGSLISGQKDAYQYLPNSTTSFLSANDLAEAFVRAGFTDVNFEKKMLGTVAIHWASKPVSM